MLAAVQMTNQESTIVCCKIPIGTMSPIKLRFDYSMMSEEIMYKVDLLIMYSFTHTNPTALNSERLIKNKPKLIIIHASD